MEQHPDQAAAESYAAIAAAIRDAAGQPPAASETDTDTEEKTAALTAVFSAWRRGLQALVGDMAGLAAAEGKLAAVGIVQLLLGALILVSLATLALICLEVTLALLLVALSLPLVAVALLLFGLNVMFALIIFRLIKPLTANLTFEHTRQMLARTSDAAVATKTSVPAQQPADSALSKV